MIHLMRSFPIALSLLTLLATADLKAQTRSPPESRREVQLSFAPVVKKAAPAVVNVYGAARVERARQNGSMDEFFRRFFGEGGPGMPRERMQSSLGSGVIVDPSGLVVT